MINSRRKIDVENNLLYVKGAIPGAINGFIIIKGQGELKFNIAPVAPVVEEEKIESSGRSCA